MTLPAHVAAIESAFEVDTALYGRDALFQACYKFTDRCFLFLAVSAPEKVVVSFKPRDDSVSIDSVIGEFANELIDQRLRADIARETREVRQLIVRQAFLEGGFE